MHDELKILNSNIRTPVRKLEAFKSNPRLTTVVLESDEVTSLCPVTGQPDWETVRIEFAPNEHCIESKSLKLYLWSFREEGHFCEELSAIIAQDIFDACKPKWVEVRVTQKSRGGVSIIANSRVNE